MNKTLLKTKQCPDYGRLPKAKLKRNRPRNIVPVTLPLHDLSGAKVHRYTLNPMVMAVRDVDINQHDLVNVDGEILKVVSVSEIAPGAVEIKTAKFARYQD